MSIRRSGMGEGGRKQGHCEMKGRNILTPEGVAALRRQQIMHPARMVFTDGFLIISFCNLPLAPAGALHPIVTVYSL